MKRPYAASSPAFPARAGKAALFGRAPHRRAKPRRSPARRASSWGLRAAPYAPPLARPRAPLAAFGAKARANDRGLARNKEGASLYASVFLLRSGSGNTAGNSAKRGTGQPGCFSLPKISARRIARPPSPARVAGQGGRPRNASFPHRPHSGRLPRHRRGSSFGAEILGRGKPPFTIINLLS